MDFLELSDSLALKNKDIIIKSPKQLLLISDLVVESPVELRAGNYNVGEIGAFTYCGGGKSVFENVKSIGRFCSIAKDVHIGISDHPTDYITTHGFVRMHAWTKTWPNTLSEWHKKNINSVVSARQIWLNRQQSVKYAPVVIGNDVWIGDGAFISRGGTIGDGAIIAARSVVTKNVPPYAIVGGIPAKIIKFRFSSEIISELMKVQWWLYGPSSLNNANFHDINHVILSIKKNIINLPLFKSNKITIKKERT